MLSVLKLISSGSHFYFHPASSFGISQEVLASFLETSAARTVFARASDRVADAAAAGDRLDARRRLDRAARAGREIL